MTWIYDGFSLLILLLRRRRRRLHCSFIWFVCDCIAMYMFCFPSFCPVFSFNVYFNRVASRDKLKKLICKFFFRHVFLSFFDVAHFVGIFQILTNLYKYDMCFVIFLPIMMMMIMWFVNTRGGGGGGGGKQMLLFVLEVVWIFFSLH